MPYPNSRRGGQPGGALEQKGQRHSSRLASSGGGLQYDARAGVQSSHNIRNDLLYGQALTNQLRRCRRPILHAHKRPLCSPAHLCCQRHTHCAACAYRVAACNPLFPEVYVLKLQEKWWRLRGRPASPLQASAERLRAFAAALFHCTCVQHESTVPTGHRIACKSSG